jgi:two-component system nitrate/nitrite response regulator NarL
MQLSDPNSMNASVQGRSGSRQDQPNPRLSEKTVKITRGTNYSCRVTLVDRDSMASDLLALALDSDDRYEATAANASQVMRSVMAGGVDLVIMGATLSANSGDGLCLAESLHCAQPEIKMIILIDDAQSATVMDAFRTGARGVFCRRQPMADFLDCVERVRMGFIWVGRQETDFIVEAFKALPKPRLVSTNDLPMLTLRELQVVQLAARAKSNRSIATELRLSEHTVKNYLFRAFAKIGVSNRVELLFRLTSGSISNGATTVENNVTDLS